MRAFGGPGLRNGVSQSFGNAVRDRVRRQPRRTDRNLGVTSRAVTDTFVLDGPPHLVPSSVKRTTPVGCTQPGRSGLETRGLP
jgi:hypothetical protein